MDQETKKYLNEKFEQMATKDDFQSIKVDIEAVAETQREMLTLIDKRFDTVEDKLDSVVNQVSGHEKRISFLEEKVLQ